MYKRQVESARAQATGYSFPSGHTQNAVGTFGGIARFTRRKWVRAAAVIVAVLVPLSRMYLGVHTPLDVGVAAVIAVVLVFALYPLMERSDSRHGVMGVTLLVMLALAAGEPSKGYVYPQHHPKVKFDESVLSTGAAVFVDCALQYLRE